MGSRKKAPQHFIHANLPTGTVCAFFEDIYQPECANEVHFSPAQARSVARRLLQAADQTDARSPPPKPKKEGT